MSINCWTKIDKRGIIYSNRTIIFGGAKYSLINRFYKNIKNYCVIFIPF